MRAYIGYSTAVLYWLRHGIDVPCYQQQAHVTRLNNAAYLPSDLKELDLGSVGLLDSTARGWPSRARTSTSAHGFYTGPSFHVLVPKNADRNHIEMFERHCWSSRIPEHSFCKLRPDIFLSLPEFSFLQLAGTLSMQQLILVGYWLCAVYRINEADILIPSEPITTVEKLRTYLDGAEGCYGARKARRALRWIVDGARSPMEAKTAMLASLPIHLGGYGLSVPLINHQIKASDFDPATLDRADRKYFEIDLYWPKYHVGVEYDGEYHYDRDKVREDKRRLNCLHANGEHILAVMYDQLDDREVRETLMYQLAKLLKTHKREPTMEELDAREYLDGILFGNEFSL